MNEEEKVKSLIEGANSILQIRIEELKSDEETVLSLSSRYRDVVSNFRSKIFGSAGAVAALLTAIIAFKGFEQYVWYFLGLLIFDLVLVALAEVWFSGHQKKSGNHWFRLDQNYASAIALINKQKAFLASRFDSINSEQIRLLITYTDILLGRCRIEIAHQIEEVQKQTHLSYIKETLIQLSDRQKKLLSDAYNSYESKKDAFEREAEFLSEANDSLNTHSYFISYPFIASLRASNKSFIRKFSANLRNIKPYQGKAKTVK